MGYYEAIEDGIHMEGDAYFPPCHICGASVFSMNYRRNLKYTCPECRQYLAEARMGQNEMSKKSKRLAEAVKRIGKITDITKYDKAIEIVTNKLNTPGWFQSTEEIMVALELVKRKIVVHHQVKVYSYSVDFVLPDYKVALEIDGSMHQMSSRKKMEAMRDEVIVDNLGRDYELIRISTENINLNVTKIMKAIDAVLKKRKEKNSR